jgi:hypothetical protein
MKLTADPTGGLYDRAYMFLAQVTSRLGFNACACRFELCQQHQKIKGGKCLLLFFMQVLYRSNAAGGG